MKTRLARREFLKNAGRGFAAVGIGNAFYDVLLGHILQAAVGAEVSGAAVVSGMNYVHLTLSGAPPRWFFDLPLTPSGQTAQNFVAGNFGTMLETTASGIKPIYQTIKVNNGSGTISLPPVWGMNLNNQNFSTLLPHTAFIRGVDMEINNHGLSNGRQVAPIIGGYSISGMLADVSTMPIPSVVDTSPAAGAFRSRKGLAVSPLSFAEDARARATVNPIGTLLKPFAEFRTGRAVHANDRARLQEQALSAIEAFGEKRGVASSALPKMYENAINLIDEKIISKSADWVSVVDKYRAIIKEALNPKTGTLPGIYDKAIKSSSSSMFRIDVNNLVASDDIRNLLNEKTNIASMAEGFAVMEVLLGVVTSSFTLKMDEMVNLMVGSSLLRLAHDQHNVGSVVSTMYTTLYYRAMLGCLTEFVTSLKRRDIFDQTLIHISSEFNRTPRLDGSGSDHGFMAGNATLISGMLKQNTVIGNIKTDDAALGQYRGTFGVAANYGLDGYKRPIQVNDIALTITSMLQIGNIVTNGRALLQKQGALWVAREGEAKNV